MLIPDAHLKCVAFLCVEEFRFGGAVTVPRATAFFVTDRAVEEPRPIWVVTARHCIQEARADGRQMYLRINTVGGYTDVPTEPDDWHEDDENDVALALLLPPQGSAIVAIPLDQFIDADYRFRGGQDFPGVGR